MADKKQISWVEAFNNTTEPASEEIKSFIKNPLYEKLCTHIESNYKFVKKTEYSGCSGQPGWNVKYKKSGKTLCTIYPMNGFFIVLVVVGNKEQNETELLLPGFSPYVRELCSKTKFSLGGRWLMIEVTEEAVLSDCIALIDIRACKH